MNNKNEIEDVIVTLKKTAKSILSDRQLATEKLELLNSLGIEYTLYNNKEVNVTEFFNDDMIFLFDEVMTGRYNIIAQVSADKVLYITDEQKKELGL